MGVRGIEASNGLPRKDWLTPNKGNTTGESTVRSGRVRRQEKIRGRLTVVQRQYLTAKRKRSVPGSIEPAQPDLVDGDRKGGGWGTDAKPKREDDTRRELSLLPGYCPFSRLWNYTSIGLFFVTRGTEVDHYDSERGTLRNKRRRIPQQRGGGCPYTRTNQQHQVGEAMGKQDDRMMCCIENTLISRAHRGSSKRYIMCSQRIQRTRTGPPRKRWPPPPRHPPRAPHKTRTIFWTRSVHAQRAHTHKEHMMRCASHRAPLDVTKLKCCCEEYVHVGGNVRILLSLGGGFTPRAKGGFGYSLRVAV